MTSTVILVVKISLNFRGRAALKGEKRVVAVIVVVVVVVVVLDLEVVVVGLVVLVVVVVVVVVDFEVVVVVVVVVVDLEVVVVDLELVVLVVVVVVVVVCRSTLSVVPSAVSDLISKLTGTLKVQPTNFSLRSYLNKDCHQSHISRGVDIEQTVPLPSRDCN
ncbi:hypothetical protein ElyMa_007052700 [Elysia marginata]|uniref:Uncharacterized protein n=1 Tax=Elysia marginata TaxID=1093978 RepID=A0AAV4JVT9_9GAST|nr:hypothetical protein ElyMa_007052700 [Elysia marginata]